jgi:hypothetical protein
LVSLFPGLIQIESLLMLSRLIDRCFAYFHLTQVYLETFDVPLALEADYPVRRLVEGCRNFGSLEDGLRVEELPVEGFQEMGIQAAVVAARFVVAAERPF